MKRTSYLMLTLSLGIMIPACGDDDPCNGHSHEDICLECTQGEADSFDAGTIKDGQDGVLKIKILNATPNPHQADLNLLRIQVLDASDNPVTGVSFGCDRRRL